jgi:hypothetical protein
VFERPRREIRRDVLGHCDAPAEQRPVGPPFSRSESFQSPIAVATGAVGGDAPRRAIPTTLRRGGSPALLFDRVVHRPV